MRDSFPSPDFATACYKTGVSLYAKQNFSEAADFFEKAIKQQPDFINAWYNLGLVCKKLANPEKARRAFEKVLSLAPTHEAAHFHLGCLIMQTGDFAAAIPHFLTIIETWPNHPETLVNLASCYLKQGGLDPAQKYYEQALQLTPLDTQILFNLGVIHAQMGDPDKAIQYYQRAIQQNNDYFEAHYNLALTFVARQHAGFALRHLKEARRLQSDNATVNYLIEAISKHKNLQAAPVDYLTELFDGYADHYEKHLLMALEYTLPQYFFQAVTKLKSGAHAYDILDIGCGTGLCGVPFREMAKLLYGVDLSEKMLAVADQKKCYDELIHADFQRYLADSPMRWDLILAGDVLVYFGNLEAVFQQIAKVLRPQGLFVFNTEISLQEDYQMNASGRFGHSSKYLAKLAKQFQLEKVSSETISSRQQHGVPVQGYLCILRQARRSLAI